MSQPDRLLLAGRVVTPADLHCHGGAGHGFPDGDLAGARTAAARHRGFRTTTLVASLVTAAVTAASATPARILGRGSVLGALRADLRTDPILVRDQLAPLPVMAAGQWQEGAR